MSDMKCPFCNGKLYGCIGHPYCRNEKCEMCDEMMPIELLDLLDRTRKALDVAKDALKSIDWCGQDYANAQGALDEITALEQKETK